MTYTLLWENTTNTSNTYLGRYDGGKTYRGEVFQTGETAVLGKIVKEVKLPLANYNGSISGTAYVVVVKSDYSEIEIGSIDVSTLTSTLTEKTFTNASNTYVMQADDMVCLKYDVVVGTSYLMTQLSTNTFTNAAFAQKQYDNPPGTQTWLTPVDSLSAVMKIYGGSSSPSGTGGKDPPPPFTLESL